MEKEVSIWNNKEIELKKRLDSSPQGVNVLVMLLVRLLGGKGCLLYVLFYGACKKKINKNLSIAAQNWSLVVLW